MQETSRNRPARHTGAHLQEHSSAEEPTLGGMQASNRRLASDWSLASRPGSADEHPAPVAKLAVESAFATACLHSLEHQWADGVLALRDPSDEKQKNKATYGGVSHLLKTMTKHDPQKQLTDTLLLQGIHVSRNLRLWLTGYAEIENIVLRHASNWCAARVCIPCNNALHNPPPECSPCILPHVTFCRIQQPYMDWAFVVKEGPSHKGSTDLDFHRDWLHSNMGIPSATRSVLSYSIKLTDCHSSIVFPHGAVAYLKSPGSIICFHSKAYHKVRFPHYRTYDSSSYLHYPLNACRWMRRHRLTASSSSFTLLTKPCNRSLMLSQRFPSPRALAPLQPRRLPPAHAVNLWMGVSSWATPYLTTSLSPILPLHNPMLITRALPTALQMGQRVEAVLQSPLSQPRKSTSYLRLKLPCPFLVRHLRLFPRLRLFPHLRHHMTWLRRRRLCCKHTP